MCDVFMSATFSRGAVSASPMWRSQAEVDGLTLVKADNKTGYYGVYHKNPGQPKPYQAEVWRGGKDVYLGSFATAEPEVRAIRLHPKCAKKCAPHTTEKRPMPSI